LKRLNKDLLKPARNGFWVWCFSKKHLDLPQHSNIVAKYGAQVQKALAKLSGVEIKLIAPSHGLIWRSQIPYILDRYNTWSKMEGEKGAVIVFGSMYGNTEKMADYIARVCGDTPFVDISLIDKSSK